MVAVAVVALLVGGLVGCGDRSSSTLVTSLPTTTAAEEAPAEVPDPSTTTVEPDPVQDPSTTAAEEAPAEETDPSTTTTVVSDPVQDPTTTVAEEAPAEVTDPSTTTVESDPGPSSTTTVEPEPVSPTTTTTTTVEAPAEVTDPTTTTSVVSDPVQDPSTTTTSVVSDPGPGPSTTIVEPEPVSPTTTTTTTVDPGLVGVGNEFSGEPVSEVGGDETLDFVEVALPPAGWDGRLPEPVGERLPYLLPTDDGWVPPDIWPEHWDQRKQRGAWVSEVVDFRVGTVREPPPYPLSADPSAEEQASFDSAYGIVVAVAPVLPSDVGIGSTWLIYWCDVHPWWYRLEDPETVNGYMTVASVYKVEGGFRESSYGGGVGPC